MWGLADYYREICEDFIVAEELLAKAESLALRVGKRSMLGAISRGKQVRRWKLLETRKVGITRGLRLPGRRQGGLLIPAFN